MPRRPGGEAEIRARMSAAPGVSAADAHRLAGLLDGESHLAIARNNDDGWRCYCAVNLREDDREILTDYQAKLGLGRLVSVAPRNGSRPQVCWTISTKVECRALVDLLDAHPLRSRKRAEYEIWREAVRLWGTSSYGLGPGASAKLAGLAERIRAQRGYQKQLVTAPLPDLTDAHAPHYFAGFFSGEGSFGLGARNVRFVVKLRRDDRPLLEGFQSRFGIGTICDVTPLEPWSPAAVWHVTGARDVLRGIVLLEEAGLLGRKQRQYQAWRPAALAICVAVITGTPVDGSTVSAAREALTQATRYHPPDRALCVGDAAKAARDAYRDVLLRWAFSTRGKLSCTAYEAVRRRLHPDWPKRETIASAFGSWYDALRAAGLEDRAARRRSARQPGVQLD